MLMQIAKRTRQKEKRQKLGVEGLRPGVGRPDFFGLQLRKKKEKNELGDPSHAVSVQFAAGSVGGASAVPRRRDIATAPNAA